MRLRNSAKAKTVALFLGLLNVYPSHRVEAKEEYFDSLAPCPLAAPIRVASATSLSDIQSLKSCAQHVVYAPSTAIVSPPPVARIIGVKIAVPALEETETEPQTRCRGCRAAPPPSHAMLYDGMIREAANTYQIDPLFLHALTWTESSYRPAAVSPAGARGLMQIMPATGRGLGVAQEHLSDPRTNVDAGARLLKKLQRRYGRNLSLILAAYNAGEGAVERYGRRIPPYRETQNYVRTVMQRYGVLRGVELVR